MSDASRDPRLRIDARIDGPGREGLTGTAPASLYARGPGREEITIAPDFAPPEAQPAWRREFPIDWPQDQYVERRDFFKFMVLTSAAFVVGQVWIGLHSWWHRRQLPEGARRIAAVADVAVGGALVFPYPGEHDPCLLVRLADGEFVAFRQKCTHLSCAVIPRPAENVLYCPCHEGRFDLRTGAPVAGPPRRPLPRVRVEIRDGQLYATGIETRTV